MRQWFYLDTEQIFKRACQLADYSDKGDLSTWREWWHYESKRRGFSDGQLEQAVWEALEIPAPGRHGFVVTQIDHELVIITDAEEAGTCDLNDADDKNMVLPVEQFREWLYRWNGQVLNRIMGTHEAAAIWGLSQDWIKKLCQDGKVKARLIGKQWILDRNQKSPKMT